MSKTEKKTAGRLLQPALCKRKKGERIKNPDGKGGKTERFVTCGRAGSRSGDSL